MCGMFNSSADRCSIGDNSTGDESMQVHIPKWVNCGGHAYLFLRDGGTIKVSAGPTCTCRYDGKLFELASYACMATSNVSRISCCG